MPVSPIGTLIAKRRHVLGMSQEQLGARVGVARDTVSMWERGKQYPQRHLGKLEDVLGISLTADSTPGIPADPRERAVYDLAMEETDSAGAWEFVEEFRRLHTKHRATA